MKKKLEINLIIVFLIVAIVIIGGISMKSSQIKPFLDEQGNIIESSIAEKIWINVNGYENGIIIRGESLNNPVLLFISGGPGVPEYWLNEYYPNDLEKYFTVCWWDYYGEGLSYDSHATDEDISLDKLMDDAVAVTDYLKVRFGKEKIYLMAHSAGTKLALPLALEHPELYEAYFSMGQVVDNGNARYAEGYKFMLPIFEAEKNTDAIERMNKLVTMDENGNITAVSTNINAKWETLLLEAGCATTRDMRSDAKEIFMPQMKSSCYSFPEKINYWRGKKACQNSNFANTVTPLSNYNFDIPVYFFSGYYDYTTPITLVEQLYEEIDAPEKAFFCYKKSAHSPLWEENKQMISDILSTCKE